MRIGILIICMLAALALGIGLLWPVAPMEPVQGANTAPPPPAAPVAEPVPAPAPPAPPEVPPPAVAQAGQDGEAEVPPEEDPVIELDPQAIASLRESMTQGDNRSPPIGRSAPGELPTPEELDSPEGYLQYEGRQERRLKAAFVRAVSEEIPVLQQLIEEARARGLAPEQLAEGEEKLRRLQAMRDELLQNDPELGELTLESRPAPDAGAPENPAPAS